MLGIWCFLSPSPEWRRCFGVSATHHARAHSGAMGKILRGSRALKLQAPIPLRRDSREIPSSKNEVPTCACFCRVGTVRLRRPRRVQRRNVRRELRRRHSDSARYCAGGDGAAHRPYQDCARSFGACSFEFLWSLGLGIWCFSSCHSSFFGSKKRSNFCAAMEFGSTLASPKSVESTQMRSASDCTLVQSTRRRLASCARQSANLRVSSSDIRLAQPCAHSTVPSANGRPHFQQVFISSSSVFLFTCSFYVLRVFKLAAGESSFCIFHSSFALACICS